jgi:hypothetical protein
MAILDVLSDVLFKLFGIKRKNENVNNRFLTDGSEDLRSPEEKKCDRKREIVNSRQIYSNGFLIEVSIQAS